MGGRARYPRRIRLRSDDKINARIEFSRREAIELEAPSACID